jgi:hypothetical protein
MRNMTVLLVLAFWAADSHAGSRGMHFAAGGMALTNSSEQGGQGPSGSTLLTHSDLFYNWDWYGFGAFFQFDKQGSAETDINLGPKVDLSAGPFYFETGYAVLAQRAYTDRSIARQTGGGWLFGVGVRVPLGQAGGQQTGGAFLQFSYKYRMLTIKKQDDVLLAEPIRQKDGYPIFGIGWLF